MSHGIFFCSLKVVLKNSSGQILALEAEKVGDLAGYYDLPGGRVDNTEIALPFPSLIDREIKEEVGDIQYLISPQPIYSLSWTLPSYPNPFIYIYYEAQYKSGEITVSDEHVAYKWIDLNTEALKEHFTGWHYQALSEFYNL